ncbi:glutathione hydrolase 1 proenzyme-like isoform X2 [Mya arenaria]|uniref:glutathione hydrolase 1 proenzyme-like isoform X2 n=1 Tax=Mya arenaria TaxID=6604 RepID=UPI0022E6C3B0|nr:glutathione hydrolase 1 proenzyme-like isoform X2 [Mya arenaria]
MSEEETRNPETPPAAQDPLFSVHDKKDYTEKPRTCKVCHCTRNRMICITVVLVMLLLYGIGLAIGLAVGLSRKNSKAVPDGVGEQHIQVPIGAVVSDHEACSDVGRDILDRQGTAVDAAIATLICNGVRTPQSMGIGGGSYMLVYDSSRHRALALDGFPIAPAAMSAILFNKTQHINARRIAVPGELKAYKYAHEHYGRLPWADLFAPTITMLREGFPLSLDTGTALQIVISRLEQRGQTLLEYPSICNIFCSDRETGEPLKAGDIHYWPNLADTLQGVADHGPDHIYNSPLTRTLVKEIQDADGVLDVKDFILNYNVVTDPPVYVELGNLTLYTMPGATGGPLVALALNILKRGFAWEDVDLESSEDVGLMYHAIIEALKFADADSLKIEDPLFNPDMTKVIGKMTSEEYADILRTKFTDKTHDYSYYADAMRSYDDHVGTSHVSVLSPYGDAVSVTSTVNWYFGSMFASNSTGIIWNNEMDDFTTQGADRINRIEPLKRPRSSMAPCIVVDNEGKVKMVVGAAGGSKIATTVAQVLVKTLLVDVPFNEVGDSKRFHPLVFENSISIERDFPKDILDELHGRGHKTTEFTGNKFTVLEAIFVSEDGEMKGYADPRKPSGKASYVFKTVTSMTKS